MKVVIVCSICGLLLTGCSLCTKRYYLPRVESRNEAIALSRKEEILAVALIADRTIANSSLGYLLMDRNIEETDSTFEVHYWPGKELLFADTLTSYLGEGHEIMVVICKETLKVKGVFGFQ